jgi:hypothetical protein
VLVDPDGESATSVALKTGGYVVRGASWLGQAANLFEDIVSGGAGTIDDVVVIPALLAADRYGRALVLAGELLDAAEGPLLNEKKDEKAAEGAQATEGPYGHLEDSKSVGKGKNYTTTQKKKIYEENMKRNGGKLVDDDSGEELVLGKRHKSGETPPRNEAQVDHYYPKSEGGTNSYKNARVKASWANRLKSNNIPK